MIKNWDISMFNNLEDLEAFHDLDFLSICRAERKVKMEERVSEYDHFRGFQNDALRNTQIPGITVVRTREEARRALDILYRYKDRIHAWDTETVDVEIKQETPVNHGKVICLQAFLGPDVPFENGPRLFIDNFGECSDLIYEFKEYFEDDGFKRAWFNYGFDRHMLLNHEINVKGFYADVMHMARLLDPSRAPNEYSLSKVSLHYSREIRQIKSLHLSEIDGKPAGSLEGNFIACIVL